MDWKKKAASAVCGGAGALAIFVGATAHAQQSHDALPLPTEAEIAASPAARRLKELLEVLNSGDAAATRVYLEANSADTRDAGKSSSMLLPIVLERYRLSRGLDLVRLAKDDRGFIVGIVRNRTTGDEETLAIEVEPQEQHRITGLPFLPPPTIAALVRPTASIARNEQEQLQGIRAYLKRLGDAEIFSGVVLIARGGKPVLSGAYGYADREKKLRNTISTPFLVGSVNKLFTGLAIGQLVEQGKLSYDDPLSKFLPDFPDPDSARKIRIKHLLSHTSGLLPGFTNKAYFESLDRLTTVQAIIDTFDRKPLQFEPGTKWAYSNMGFVLLGRIVEIVTGQDYFDYMQKDVFGRAGADSVSFPILPGNGVAAVPMALPYEVQFKDDRALYVNKLGAEFRRGGPSCCFVASALDFLKLSNALRAGRIVKPETLRLHSNPKPELGAPNWGYGIIPYQMGRPLVGHGGTASGQCAEFRELKDTPYTIIVLSNVWIGTCKMVTEKILRLLPPTKAPAA